MSILCKQKSDLTRANFSFSLFSLFIAPNYLVSGKMYLRPCIPLAVYCVKLVVCDRRVANKRRKGLDKALHKSYNTTPAEEEKALELGVCFPALKG